MTCCDGRSLKSPMRSACVLPRLARTSSAWIPSPAGHQYASQMVSRRDRCRAPSAHACHVLGARTYHGHPVVLDGDPAIVAARAKTSGAIRAEGPSMKGRSVGVILHGPPDATAAGKSPYDRKLSRHVSLADAVCTATAPQNPFAVGLTGLGHGIPRHVPRSS